MNRFVMIPLEIIRSDTLTMNAKCLYGLIKSYVTIPNFELHKEFFRKQCPDVGRDKFDKVWKELTAAGYLITERGKDASGKWCWQIRFIEKPYTENPYTENGKPCTENHVRNISSSNYKNKLDSKNNHSRGVNNYGKFNGIEW